MSEERLQKILARAGMASRRHAEEVIAEGRVTVNGRVAAVGDKADLERDAIKVDGKRLHAATGDHRYLLLNKPRAVMSTISDPEGRPTVLDLVPLGMRKALVPVGRLDFLTEGLILLTDDGELAQRVAHPRYGCTKTYEVKVRGTPDARTLDRLRHGIVLDGERTRPAEIEPRFVPGESENSWWTVELGQGRTRQIREMFQRVGHPVMKLRRVAIGPVRDPDLPVGQLRELTEREVDLLRRAGRHREKAKKAAAKAAREGRVRKPRTEKSAKRKAGEEGESKGGKRLKAAAGAPKGGTRGGAGGRSAAATAGGAGRGTGTATRKAAGPRSAGADGRTGRGAARSDRGTRVGEQEPGVAGDRRPSRPPSGAARGRTGGAETGGDRRAHRSPEARHGRRAEAARGRAGRSSGGREEAVPVGGGASAGGGGEDSRGRRGAARPCRPDGEKRPRGPARGTTGPGGRGASPRGAGPGGRSGSGGAARGGSRGGAKPAPGGRSGPGGPGRGGSRGGSKPGPAGRSGGGGKPRPSGGRSGGGGRRR